jgi:hypothetical protein
VREVGYGLSLEGASSADLAKSIPARGEPLPSPTVVDKKVVTFRA